MDLSRLLNTRVEVHVLGLGQSLAAGDRILPGLFLVHRPLPCTTSSTGSWRHSQTHQGSPDHPLGMMPSASRLSCPLHSHPKASPEQMEFMSHILLQEIKLRKDSTFTVNINYRKDWENVFSLPDSKKKLLFPFKRNKC